MQLRAIYSGTVFAMAIVTAAGCPEPEPDPVERDCESLCDRTVLCTENHVAPEIASENDGTLPPEAFDCSFDDGDEARADCQSGCVEEGAGPTAKACIACLADNMGCTTTASMRECDVDCEPTMFVTGRDGEGALEYNYASWFFDGVSDLEGITCVAEEG